MRKLLVVDFQGVDRWFYQFYEFIEEVVVIYVQVQVNRVHLLRLEKDGLFGAYEKNQV